MKLITAKVINQVKIAKDQFVLRLYCPDIVLAAKPGQFITLKIHEQPLLRRPFSIHYIDKEKGYLEIFYQVVGRTTKDLSNLSEDADVSLLGPLGNGFTLKENSKALLIGGGLGQAPLRFLATELKLLNTEVEVLLGARHEEGLKNLECFMDQTGNIHCATEDGSKGVKGFVTEVLPDIIKEFKPDIIYTCGPIPMLKAIKEIATKSQILCQISLEKTMACGIGVCLGCTCKSKNDEKYPKVCIDGPVFWAEGVDIDE
ncbi:dihydroorotate dehydrogenase electron transfer subunit [Desulfonispora thiosulfatigenes DSM 11270]|uniref:Dihydroorotate dehydrogenase B (NAD(+)), electron transfer subunit n=1 Tax=Desulfonispora thiosulfatigenes DSM 11270 TaxID=656914 RepID=A0A1W1VGX9_DESTI|nr:dihydroorotate dehydrogenase electron transfer subunit [Desulfonispora thiosulfatigenes]SMB92602.1 dihydroorotate dehydrogenase electron transfer subunit [Desulfonispora thiosulfatigenes DSM 11270]